MSEYAWSVAIPMGALVLAIFGVLSHARIQRARRRRQWEVGAAIRRAWRRELGEQWYRERKAEEARFLRDIGWTDLTATEESK